MCTFYRGTIESILTSCITVWYGACNASCRKSLQRIVRAAEKIVGVSLPSLQDIYNTRLTRKALSIAGDPTHPTHNFFSLLPSGRRLRSLQARTNRLKDSFIHQAVRKLNSLPSLPPLPSLTPRITELGPPPHHHHPHEHRHRHTHTHTHTHTLSHTHVGFCEKWGHPIGVMVFILYKLYVLLPYTNPTPKLSPHRRLCISTFPQKTSLCMIYKRFEKWGHGSMS